MNQAFSEELACAIVVTFHPEESAQHHLTSLIEQFQLIVVVDNGSTPSVQHFLKQLAAEEDNLIVHQNSENVGLATALNIGANIGLSKNATLLHTFDQDSIVDKKYAASMYRFYCELDNKNTICGCNYWNEYKNRPLISKEKCISTKTGVSAKTVITSGMMLSTDLYQKIGPFEESYFIDSIDHEYCLRTRQQGASVLINPEILFTQTIGVSHHRASGKVRRASYQHSTNRIYYKSRNSLLTIKKYIGSDPLWCIRHFAGLCVELFEIIIYEKLPGRKLKYFGLGVFHGVIGRRGALNQ